MGLRYSYSARSLRIFLLVAVAATLVGCAPRVPLPKVSGPMKPLGLSTKAVAADSETGQVVLEEVEVLDK